MQWYHYGHFEQQKIKCYFVEKVTFWNDTELDSGITIPLRTLRETKEKEVRLRAAPIAPTLPRFNEVSRRGRRTSPRRYFLDQWIVQ